MKPRACIALGGHFRAKRSKNRETVFAAVLPALKECHGSVGKDPGVLPVNKNMRKTVSWETGPSTSRYYREVT